MTDIELLKNAIDSLNNIMLPVGMRQQIEQIGIVSHNLQLLLNAIEESVRKKQEEEQIADEMKAEIEGEEN